MRTGKNVLLATLAAIAVIAISSAAMSAATVGSQAPDFQLPNLTNGGNIRLSDDFDKPTLLVFFTSWCPHCREELPTVQKLQEQCGNDQMHILLVSLDTQPQDAQNLIKQMSLTFPIAYGNSKVAADYGVRGVPAIFVLDKGGIIKARHEGTTGEGVIRGDLAAVGVK